MIIETSDNRFYRVTETNQPGLEHCWFGRRVKLQRASGKFINTAKTTGDICYGRDPELVRKAATRIVEA